MLVVITHHAPVVARVQCMVDIRKVVLCHLTLRINPNFPSKLGTLPNYPARRIRLKLCAVGPMSGWVARNIAMGTTSSGSFTHSLGAKE